MSRKFIILGLASFSLIACSTFTITIEDEATFVKLVDDVRINDLTREAGSRYEYFLTNEGEPLVMFSFGLFLDKDMCWNGSKIGAKLTQTTWKVYDWNRSFPKPFTYSELPCFEFEK